MATRVYLLPGPVLLLCAFILSLLVTISLPKLPSLHIVRTNVTDIDPDGFPIGYSTVVKYGIWGTCIDRFEFEGVHHSCIDEGFGYTYDSQSDLSNVVTTITTINIGPGSTHALAIHPVATAATFIALLFSLLSSLFLSHVRVTLFASLLSFIAGLLTIAAFAIDISLYFDVRETRQGPTGVSDIVRIVAGPGTWITLASSILLFMAACAVWLGRRRSRMEGATNHPPPDSEKSGIFAILGLS